MTTKALLRREPICTCRHIQIFCSKYSLFFPFFPSFFFFFLCFDCYAQLSPLRTVAHSGAQALNPNEAEVKVFVIGLDFNDFKKALCTISDEDTSWAMSSYTNSPCPESRYSTTPSHL